MPVRSIRLPLLIRLALFALVLGALSISFEPLPVFAQSGSFNQSANTLISDQFNNRVIEVDPEGNIVWHFGLGPKDFSAKSIIGVNDAQRVGDLTLMAGTGTPGGQPEAPDCTDSSGCPDNRVLLVNRYGHIVWQYGTFGPGGNGPGQLNTPTQVTWTPNRHVLITDQANGRIIEVRVFDKKTVWEYDGLNGPNCAELLENGHILICDEGNNQALEVTHTKPSTVVHTYTMAGGVLFSAVAFASRLPNGHTLITDSGNSRIVETNENGTVFWQYFTNTDSASNPRCLPAPTGCTGPLPTRAVRLGNGHTLISDQYNHRVIEVDHSGDIVRTFGKINSLGYNTTSVEHGGLNSPYDAKRIGDYTGLTPPFDDDQDNNEQ
jgi:hypothetical protein